MANTPTRTTFPTDGPQTDGSNEAVVSLADLNNQLNRAYLSGDGATVERVMALIAASQHQASLVTSA